jgi:hypothetical protein
VSLLVVITCFYACFERLQSLSISHSPSMFSCLSFFFPIILLSALNRRKYLYRGKWMIALVQFSFNYVLGYFVWNKLNYFSNHLALVADCKLSKERTASNNRRNWKRYSKESLLLQLSQLDCNIQDDLVQGYWNTFNNKPKEVIYNLIVICRDNNNVSNTWAMASLQNTTSLQK